MNILYISNLVSSKCIDEIFSQGYKPLQSVQKFHKLLALGFAKNSCKIQTISGLPVNNIKVRMARKDEEEDSILYTYCTKIALNGADNLIISMASFFKTLNWIFANKKNNSIVILDTLTASLSFGALIACKMLRVKTVGIVTDIAGMKKIPNASIKQKMANSFIRGIMQYYDAYILLTEQMNEVMNSRRKPYIIMEGLVDIAMQEMPKVTIPDKKKVVLYAGGLYAQYGLRDLIEGFIKIDDSDIQLHLYGHGDMIEEIQEYCKNDNRIRYFGVVHNDQIVEAEIVARLLVNPRPTSEEFTKYSFPSKNMEYMASGTPVLTTVLPGMPKEYHQHVYLLKEENPVGMYKKLKELLLNTPGEELKEKGKCAREFVLQKKNNVIQAKRIMTFIEGLSNNK